MSQLPIDSDESISQEMDVPSEGLGLSDGGMSIGEEKNDLDKLMEMAFDEKNIFHLTELNQGEITGFSTLGVLHEKYMPRGIALAWLIRNLKMRVSKQRKGKAEFVKMGSRHQEQPGYGPPQSNSGIGGFFRR